jgi:4-nitrophenyl phosphatase
MISSKITSIILDMDGVLWSENNPIGDLPMVFQTISKKSLSVALATNNSTRTPIEYIERLRKFGVNNLEPWQIITSSLALATDLVHKLPDKGDVFVIGENGLKTALLDVGFNVVDDEHTKDVVAIAVGIDRNLTFNKLRRATLLIRSGLPFYGTNPDKTFPTPEGLILGTGALIAALSTATDVNPVIMGKPSPYMISLARKRLKSLPDETLVVGDRLETDIAGGQADGCHTALVLSGVTSLSMANNWHPSPDIIAKDLSALLEII